MARVGGVLDVVVLATGACGTVQLEPLATAETIAPSATASCAAIDQRVTSLRLGPGDEKAVERTISWSKAMPPSARRLNSVYDVEGPCALSISRYISGVGLLSTGEGFSINAGLQINPTDGVRPKDPTRGPDTGRVPKIVGAEFVEGLRAAYRNVEGSLERDYYAVYRIRREWLVAAFSEVASKATSPAVELLRSKEPLLSLDYLPSPDSRGGQIGLVQKVSDDAVRLILYDLDERSIFPVPPARPSSPFRRFTG